MKTFNIFAVVLLIIGLIVGTGVGMIAFPKTITQTKTTTKITTSQVTILKTETTTVELTQKVLSENEYRMWAMKISSNLKDVLEAVSATAYALSKLKISFSDGAEIFEALEDYVEDMYDETVNMIPPPKYEDSHHHLVNALDYYRQSLYYATEGSRKMDSSLIEKATELMERGTEEIRKAKLPT